MALSVPLSRFTSRVGGGSAFYVRPHYTTKYMNYNPTLDIIAVVLIVSVAGLVARVCCRLLQRRSHRTSLLLAIPIAVAVGSVYLSLMYCSDHWFRGGGTPFSSYALPIFTMVSVVALIPALLVIWMERRRFRNVDHVA